jgi:hypothetical protein
MVIFKAKIDSKQTLHKGTLFQTILDSGDREHHGGLVAKYRAAEMMHKSRKALTMLKVSSNQIRTVCNFIPTVCRTATRFFRRRSRIPVITIPTNFPPATAAVKSALYYNETLHIVQNEKFHP